MTSTAVPPQQQPGQQPGATQPQPQQAGLPQTGMQQGLASLQQFYQQAQGAGAGQGVGQPQQAALPGIPSAQPAAPGGQVNIQQMARQLATRYGLPMGRGELIDPQGNFQVTPEQVAAASGGSETMGMAAQKMNYISQAVAAEQNRQQQRQGVAAISAGAGLVQSRSRGSLASMQSGFYQDLADLYSNQEYEAADFSFFIEEERFQIQQELQRQAEDRAKKKARVGFIAGIAGIALAPFTGGATASLGGGIASAGETGWF